MELERIKIGTLVGPISQNRGIAIFTSDKGGKFIKVKEQNGTWKAITLLDYKGPGLVVFLKDLNDKEDVQNIGIREALRNELKVVVREVFQKYAVGEILRSPTTITPEANKKVDNAFDYLCELIDTTEGDTLEFGEEIFNKSEYALILKIQCSLYKFMHNASRTKIGTDSNPALKSNAGSNEASNQEQVNL